MKIQLKRSNVLSSGAAKVPTASQLEYGELAVNYNNSDPAIFLKDSNNNVIRISGVGNISDDGLTNVPDGTSPPSNPEVGNLWYNSDQGRLYIYFQDADTSQWVDASPDSWDPSSYPDVTNSSAQSNTLDDRYAMVNGGNSFTGNVGIGTTSPGRLLEVNSNAATFVRIRSSDTGNAGLEFGDQSSAGKAAIFLNSTDNSLRFNGYNNAERLRIDSSGKVGIGTGSPGRTLHLHQGSSASTQMLFTNSTTSSSATRGFEVGLGADEQAQLWLYENTFMRFATNNTERMRINSSGFVGIGTTNPLRPLHISKAGAEGIEIKPGEESNVNLTLHFNRSANTYIENRQRASTHTFFNSGSETMRIDSSGRLLVGSTSARTNYFNGNTYGPSLNIESNTNSDRVVSFVHNDGASGAPLFVLGNSGNNSTPGGTGTVAANAALGFISFQGGDGTELVEAARIQGSVDGFVSTTDMPGRLDFLTTPDGGTSPLARMRITSTGNVGIGTTSPSHQLTVHGATTTTGTIEANRFSVRDNYGSVSGLGNGFVSPAANTLAFATASTERMRIDNVSKIIATQSSNFYSRIFGFNISNSTSSVQYNGWNVGDLSAAGTRPGYSHEPGMWMVLGYMPCDNTYRTVLTSIRDASGMFHGYCGDASSRNIYQYQYNLTSPGYNVNNLSARFINGAWNTGSVSFQIVTNGSSYDLQMKATSYYNSANNASFRITFHTYY